MTSKSDKMKKPKESPLAKITYRVISERITPLIAKTGLTPNQVSVISIIMALVSGVFFALGTWEYLLWAFVFLQLTLIFDHVDGNLARYTNKATEFGRWADVTSNKVHKFFWLLGASIGVFRMTDNPLYLILGSIAIFNWHFSAYISETSKRLFESNESLPKMFNLGRTFFTLSIIGPNLLGLSALLNRVDYGLWFFAVFVSIWIVVKVYLVHKKWKKLGKR